MMQPRHPRQPRRTRLSMFDKIALTVQIFAILAAIGAAAYIGYVRLTHRHSTVAASAYKIVFEPDALRPHPEFQCKPEKNSCSTMTSCAEAFFHLEQCWVDGMDGDRDGIPCERQWCN